MSREDPAEYEEQVVIKTEEELPPKQTTKAKTKKPKSNKETAGAEELPVSLLGDVAPQHEPLATKEDQSASSSSTDPRSVVKETPDKPREAGTELVPLTVNTQDSKPTKKRPNDNAKEESITVFGSVVKRIKWADSAFTPSPTQVVTPRQPATLSAPAFPKPTAQPLAKPSMFSAKPIA